VGERAKRGAKRRKDEIKDEGGRMEIRMKAEG
jgi:hypothetical protein